MDIKNNNITLNHTTNEKIETISKLEKSIPKNRINESNSNLSSKLKNNEIEMDKKQVEKAISKVNKSMIEKNIVFDYKKDEDSGKIIIELKDVITNEIIRQIPSKEMLKIADNISKYLEQYTGSGISTKSVTNLLINQKV